MNKVNKVMMIGCLLAVSCYSEAAENYFSCNTAKGLLSLKINSNRLVYKMENSNGKGFSYSSVAPLYKDFLYNHYSRFQTDYFNVSFSQSGFKYTIFSNYEDGNSSRGVTVVSLKSKKEYTYDCKDEGVDKLSDLASKLQCDKDSALGCQ